MIGQSFRYKTLDFTDAVQHRLQATQGYSYPLQDIEYQLANRTQTILNENYHWGLLSQTLYGVRYFNFEGIALWLDKQARGIVHHLLRTALTIEANPQKNPYYSLFWKTDDGRDVFCKAKVTESITFKNALGDLRMPYEFQLASPSEKYYGIQLHSVEKHLWSSGGTTLSTSLGVALGGYGGEIVIENKGNRQAPVRIQIQGKCTNPKIINLTNSQKFRLEAITSDLVYDNQNLDFAPNKELVVEDKKINIKNKRSTGGHIYLESWYNRLVVLTDDPNERATITVLYRDTYA